MDAVDKGGKRASEGEDEDEDEDECTTNGLMRRGEARRSFQPMHTFKSGPPLGWALELKEH